MSTRNSKSSAQSNAGKVDPRIEKARAEFAAKKAAAAKKTAATKRRVAQAANEVADEVVGPAEEQGDVGTLWQQFTAAFENLTAHPDFKTPSWQRTVCSLLASALVGSGVAYLMGAAVNIMVMGTLMLTTSAFLASLMSIIGLVMTFIACWVAGAKVFTFVADGSIDKLYASTKSKVLGFFDNLGGEKGPSHA